jgi:hypothetical protein
LFTFSLFSCSMLSSSWRNKPRNRNKAIVTGPRSTDIKDI